MHTMLKTLCFALVLGPTAALADTLVVDKVQSDVKTASELPRRGMAQQAVLAKFGEPQSRLPAVGEPAISRWQYGNYIVYFERDRVLHTVVRR